MLDESIDDVVVFFQRNELKGWFAVHSYHHRLLVAQLTEVTKFRFGLT